MINTYEGTKTMKVSCIMSFKLRQYDASLNSIFVACGNLLVYFSLPVNSIIAELCTISERKVVVKRNQVPGIKYWIPSDSKSFTVTVTVFIYNRAIILNVSIHPIKT